MEMVVRKLDRRLKPRIVEIFGDSLWVGLVFVSFVSWKCEFVAIFCIAVGIKDVYPMAIRCITLNSPKQINWTKYTSIGEKNFSKKTRNLDISWIVMESVSHKNLCGTKYRQSTK